MKSQIRILFGLLAIGLFVLVASTALRAAAPAGQTGDGSLHFVPNEGQFEPEVHYRIYGGAHAGWLTADSLWLALVDPASVNYTAIRLALTPSGTPAELEVFDRQQTTYHYLGGDRNHTHLPAWGGVRLEPSTAGSELLLTGAAGELFMQTDASLRLELVGANILSVDGDIALLETMLGDFPLRLPAVSRPWTLAGVSGAGETAQWAMPAANPAGSGAGRALDGDQLLYSTFIGGEALEQADAIALDDMGAAYITGHTESVVFPGETSQLSSLHGIDAYLAKVAPAGDALDYLTWINPNPGQPDDLDFANSLALDSTEHAYLAGWTLSPEFCSFLGNPPGFDTTHNGGLDAMFMKFTVDGSALEFCSYLGGDESDKALAIEVDDAGVIYVAGNSWSDDFPTTPGAYSETLVNLSDAFVTSFDPGGVSQRYGTFVGGDLTEDITAIDVDESGNIYAAGWTSSDNFPTTPGAFQMAKNDNFDAFVLKLNNAGSDLDFATFLGGDNEDRAWTLQLGPADHVFVGGQTLSPDFPTTSGAFDETHNGNYDAFVSELNASGTTLAQSTFLGGAGSDIGRGLAVDCVGSIFLVGETFSTDYPTTVDAYDSDLGGLSDVLISGLASDNTLLYSSYLGGALEDYGAAIALDEANRFYVTGRALSPDFPTTDGAYDTSHNGDYDIFVSNLAPEGLQTNCPVSLFLPLIMKDQ